MTEIYVLSGLLIGAGLYISYQHYVISKYRRWIAVATICLEQAYVVIKENATEEKDRVASE